MGNSADAADLEQIVSSWTKFGIAGAQLSAFAVIEGPETDLFRRMALRAGSIVPAEFRDQMSTDMCRAWRTDDSNGKPIFIGNANPLAVWLNVVLTCIATYQPERFRESSLAVDPFAASIPACEYLIRYCSVAGSSVEETASALANAHFHVALSFPGERRQFISEVADGLRAAGLSIFYDAYFEPDLARPDLDVLLQRIYHDQSDLVAVFLCREYEEKEWCGLEWRALRDLIKKRRGHSIMPLRFDDTEIPGLFSIDGYIDLRNRTSSEVVELIQRRLHGLTGDAPRGAAG